ncbi:MAG: serine/threonine protein kinase [Verrucomicrobia bacterium]|nr:serine/threonine protein kinase [Verrucomicrobiota bacterium]
MAQACRIENPEGGLPEGEQTALDTPGQSETGADLDPFALKHGSRFAGRFKLRRALGSGDEGGVWLATDERLDRPVTLKLLPETICGNLGALAELREIVRRSSELVHAHIARTYEFVEAEQIAGVVLEYVDGESLTQLRLERPQQIFEVNDLTAWIRSLCEALEYAHGRVNLVHGGLRPDNVLVDAAGQLKLTGFGLAGRIRKWLGRLGAGTAPNPDSVPALQRVETEPAVSDDVYGAGATVYELLTGTAPFDTAYYPQMGGNALLASMADRRAQRGIKSEPIPVTWEQTVAACLARDPVQRPQSATELLARLAGRP